MKSILLIICCAMFATLAKATVTIDFQIGSVNTTSSLVKVPLGTIGILVADNGGTGLPSTSEMVGASLSVNSLIGDSRILSVMQADSSSNYAGGVNGLTIDGGTGITGAPGIAGTDLAFYWFPGITTIGATVSDGQSYGFYRSNTVDLVAGSDFSFNMPSDGATGALYAFTVDQGGSSANNSFVANLTASAVPEPSRALLTVIGLGAFLMRRRRLA